MKSEDIPLNRLYGELSWLWPLFSPPEDYVEEACHWRTLLRELLGPGSHSVVELGSGGGHNLSHLTPDFDAVAVDLSEEMLELSRKLNPGVEHIPGDMRSIRLGRVFDAVLIHDGISHITSETDLTAVFETAACHLRPGGVVIAAPDWFRETFKSIWTAECSYSSEDMGLTAFEYLHDPDPDDTVIEALLTFIIDRGGVCEIEHDRMLLGLFPMALWRKVIRSAGFTFSRRKFFLYSANQEYSLLVGKRK